MALQLLFETEPLEGEAPFDELDPELEAEPLEGEAPFDELETELETELEPELDREILAGPQFAGLTLAERKALAITSTLETGRAGGFFGLTGNFDQMGVSFGLLNWNIGSGSLQPLLHEHLTRFPARWKAAFLGDADRFAQVLSRTGATAKAAQLAFVISELNRETRDAKTGKVSWSIVEPWRSHFERLAADPEFQAIQVRAARGVLARAKYFCDYFGLRSERAFCMMFDAVSSHGMWWLTKKDAAGVQARRLLLRGKLEALKAQAGGGAVAEAATLRAVAETLGETSRSEWRERVRVRKLWFLTGVHPRAKELRGLEPTDAPFTVSSETPAPNPTPAPASAPNPAQPPKPAPAPNPAPAPDPAPPPPIPRLVRREASPGGTTLYLALGAGVPGIAALTSVFIPAGLRPGAEVDAILYLHGHGGPSPIDRYWRARNTSGQLLAPLREGLAASGKHALLIAPSLGATSQIGTLAARGGLDRFLAAALAGTAAHAAWTHRAPRLRHLILAGHSGAVIRVHQLAHGGERSIAESLRECWLLEGFYNPKIDRTWIEWARRNPARKVVALYVTRGPRATGEGLAARGRELGLRNVVMRVARAEKQPHWDLLRLDWPRLIGDSATLAT